MTIHLTYSLETTLIMRYGRDRYGRFILNHAIDQLLFVHHAAALKIIGSY